MKTAYVLQLYHKRLRRTRNPPFYAHVFDHGGGNTFTT